MEKFIESQPGTPEGNRMDVLVTLIEAYEDKYFPIHADLLIGKKAQKTIFLNDATLMEFSYV